MNNASHKHALSISFFWNQRSGGYRIIVSRNESGQPTYAYTQEDSQQDGDVEFEAPNISLATKIQQICRQRVGYEPGLPTALYNQLQTAIEEIKKQ